jgi:hypothetical protein
VICNANEEAVNGICVSKCPGGTFAKGGLCVSEKTVVPLPAGTTACIVTAYGSYKKWLCDKSSDTCSGACEAAKLLKDPDANTTYVDPKDQVCVSDDPTTKMYFCQTGAVAKLGNAGIAESRTSYNGTCDNLSKNYTDLSGALNTIANIKENLLYGRVTIGRARDSLQSVYTNLNCTTSTVNEAICVKVLAGRNAIGTNYTSVDTALTAAIAPIQEALDSRNFLRNQLYNFRCANYQTAPTF